MSEELGGRIVENILDCVSQENGISIQKRHNSVSSVNFLNICFALIWQHQGVHSTRATESDIMCESYFALGHVRFIFRLK